MEPTQPPQVPITPPQQFPQPATSAPASGGWKMPVAIIVGVLVIAGGAYALMNRAPAFSELTPSMVLTRTPTATPTPDPTAGWKTYTNTEYGFEFRYPADRTLEGPNISYTSETPRIVSIGLGDMEHPFYNKERFTLSVYDPTSQKTIEEGGCRSADKGCISEYRIINGARFLVNAYRVSDGMSSGSQEKNAVIIHDGKLFNFYTGFSGGYYSDMSIPELAAKRILFDQILSTFKFIEPTSVVPADWKTYMNTKYGYQVKYDDRIYTLNAFASKEDPKADNVLFFPIARLDSPEPYAVVAIEALPNPQALSPESYLKQNYQKWLGTPSRYTDFLTNAATIFNGIEARIFGTEREQYVLITKGEFAFTLTNMDEGISIIDTFKFTK